MMLSFSRNVDTLTNSFCGLCGSLDAVAPESQYNAPVFQTEEINIQVALSSQNPNRIKKAIENGADLHQKTPSMPRGTLAYFQDLNAHLPYQNQADTSSNGDLLQTLKTAIEVQAIVDQTVDHPSAALVSKLTDLLDTHTDANTASPYHINNAGYDVSDQVFNRLTALSKKNKANAIIVEAIVSYLDDKNNTKKSDAVNFDRFIDLKNQLELSLKSGKLDICPESLTHLEKRFIEGLFEKSTQSLKTKKEILDTALETIRNIHLNEEMAHQIDNKKKTRLYASYKRDDNLPPGVKSAQDIALPNLIGVGFRVSNVMQIINSSGGPFHFQFGALAGCDDEDIWQRAERNAKAKEPSHWDNSVDSSNLRQALKQLDALDSMVDEEVLIDGSIYCKTSEGTIPSQLTQLHNKREAIAMIQLILKDIEQRENIDLLEQQFLTRWEQDNLKTLSVEGVPEYV